MRFCFTSATILLLSCCCCLSYGQYDNVWAFGNFAGINFNTSSPVPVTTQMSTNEGSASISAPSGKLLFYTDGTTVWDGNNNIMPNGTNLTGTGINITASTTQGTLIVPAPGSITQYYVFSLGNRESSIYFGKLYYSMVDMALNNGLGAVITKGRLLDSFLTEQMTAVTGNECNIWLLVLSRTDKIFKAYNIDRSGINANPVVSLRMGEGLLDYGSIDVSPDRNKVAFTWIDGLFLYNFDPDFGKITSPSIVDRSNRDNHYYGICFSPDNTKLYATSPSQLVQFDLSLKDTSAVTASKAAINAQTYGAVRRGPDGKVYSANYLQSALHVINKPDLAGTACAFVANGFPLPTGTQSLWGLPNLATIITSRTIYRSQTDTIFCRKSLLLNAIDTPGINYIWNNSTTLQELLVDSPGVYWVSYTINSPCMPTQCVDTFHVFWDSIPRSKYTTITNSGSCKADSIAMQASNLNGIDYDYTWEDGSIGKQRKINQTGIYWVNYHIDSSCEYYVDTFIITYPLKDYELSFEADTLACVGDPVTFHNTSDELFNNFQWSYGDGHGNTTRNPQYSYTSAGTYEVKLIGSIGGRCVDSVISYITVDSVFPLGLQTDRNIICVGESVNFFPNTDSNTLTLLWQFDDGERITTSNVTRYQYAYAYSGTFPVQLMAYNRACPDTEITDTVEVYPLPYIDLGADNSICLYGQPIVLKNKVALQDDAYHYQWNTGDTTATLQVYHYGNYSLTITQKPIGCSNTESIDIVKDCNIDIPNTFTPNGDGINDFFFPRQLLSEGMAAFSLHIYNRWGVKLYQTTSTDDIGWDGRYRRIDQPMGVYIYHIDVLFKNGNKEAYTGNVTLIR